MLSGFPSNIIKSNLYIFCVSCHLWSSTQSFFVYWAHWGASLHMPQSKRSKAMSPPNASSRRRTRDKKYQTIVCSAGQSSKDVGEANKSRDQEVTIVNDCVAIDSDEIIDVDTACSDRVQATSKTLDMEVTTPRQNGYVTASGFRFSTRYTRDELLKMPLYQYHVMEQESQCPEYCRCEVCLLVYDFDSDNDNLWFDCKVTRWQWQNVCGILQHMLALEPASSRLVLNLNICKFTTALKIQSMPVEHGLPHSLWQRAFIWPWHCHAIEKWKVWLHNFSPEFLPRLSVPEM